VADVALEIVLPRKRGDRFYRPDGNPTDGSGSEATGMSQRRSMPPPLTSELDYLMRSEREGSERGVSISRVACSRYLGGRRTRMLSASVPASGVIWVAMTLGVEAGAEASAMS